ncbi:MAG: hypothetical protein LBB81_10835 [Treponema sp.]|nr:hypothetical protein [Treponema sp.]
MKKLKVFLLLLTCLLAFGSCGDTINSVIKEKTKDGKVKVTNSSGYSEDNPVNMKLLKGDGTIFGNEDVGANSSVTWTGVPAEVSMYIKVTDKNGRVSQSYSFSIDLNETAEYSYNGKNIERVYKEN